MSQYDEALKALEKLGSTACAYSWHESGKWSNFCDCKYPQIDPETGERGPYDLTHAGASESDSMCPDLRSVRAALIAEHEEVLELREQLRLSEFEQYGVY